jgi:hypothetical protein
VSDYLKRPDWVRRFNMLGPALGSDAELVRLAADEHIRTVRRGRSGGWRRDVTWRAISGTGV